MGGGASAATPLCRRWSFLSSLLLLLLWLSISCAIPSRNPPLFIGSYVASPNVQLTASSGSSYTLWMRSLSIVTEDGNAAIIRQTFDYGTPGPNVGYYELRGSFGCAQGRLELSFADDDADCTQLPGSTISGLCLNTLPRICSGVYDYSIYEDLEGNYALQIAGFCSMNADVVLRCADCRGAVPNCSPLVNQVVLQSGSATVNDSIVIIDANSGGNVNMTFGGNEITIDTSRNFTIDSSSPNITIVLNSSTAVVQSQANTTNLNTGPLRTCTDWLSYVGTTATNRTVNNIATPLSFGSIVIDTGDGGDTWSATGPSAVQYGGSLVGASYAMAYCLQEARVYLPADNAEEQVLLVQLVNITDGVNTPLGASLASSVTARNANGTQGILTSACGTFVTDAVRPGDEYALYVSAESLESGTPSLVLRGGASFSLAFMPAGCSGVLNNITFNITVSFANGTLIEGGYYINVTTDEQDGSFKINNEGLVDVTPNTAGTYPERCLYGTRDDMGILTLHDSSVCAVDANGGTPRGGRVSLQSSASVNVTNTGGSNFSFSTEVLSFKGSKCYTLTKSGSEVTAGGTAICDITVNGAGSSCLSGAVNDDGNFTLTTEGVCGFQDTSTVTFAQPSPGIYSASVTFPAGQNMSKCVTCDETTGELDAPNGIETPTISSPNGTVKVNGNLDSDKECSASQCNSKPDPPSSSPAILIIRRICFGCGSGENGGDSDDSGSDGPDGGVIPFVPFFPFLPFLPFFPPFVPFFPIAGGMTGGSGVVPSSGPPGAPPSPVPFVTILVNATVPLTIGGLYIPYVNFTEDIIYCGVEDRGNTVIDESTLPHILYICLATLNGTYAWVPHPAASAYTSNFGETFQNTSHVYTQGSTLFVSNSSQLWVEGNTYLAGETYARNVTITQQLSVCNSTAKISSIESCAGGAVDFPAGITIAGVPITPGTNGSISFCTPTPSPLSVDSITSCNGVSPVSMPTGVEATTVHTTLVESTDPFTFDAPSVSFTGSVDICTQPLFVNTVSSCDGTSKVNFPTGINTSVVVTAELQAPPSGTIVISGTNVTVSGPVSAPGGVSTTTLEAVTATITTQVVNNQNVLNQTVTTQNVQDITVVNTPVFGGTAFYYTAAASYSGDLTFCVSWDADTPSYTGCSSPSTPSAATVNVQLQRVGNMVYGTMNRTDTELGQLLFSTGTANSCTLFAPVGVIVGSDFRPRAGTIAAGTEAQPFLLENQGTTNAGCFCSLVPYVTDQGLLFFRPRQPTATLAHQCCTLSDTTGTFKSSTAFAIAARGTYSGLLAGNTFSAGLDDLYTFSYVLPL